MLPLGYHAALFLTDVYCSQILFFPLVFRSLCDWGGSLPLPPSLLLCVCIVSLIYSIAATVCQRGFEEKQTYLTEQNHSSEEEKNLDSLGAHSV